jgi:hypothetical protein
MAYKSNVSTLKEGGVYYIRHKKDTISIVIRVIEPSLTINGITGKSIKLRKLFFVEGYGDTEHPYYLEHWYFNEVYEIVYELEDKGDDPINYPFMII